MTLRFKPTSEMSRAAKSALERRERLPESRRAMTETGLARARQLAEGRDLDLADIVEMGAWFERHAETKGADASDPDSKWAQAWDGWGGDAGRAAVRRWLGEEATRTALAERQRSDAFRLDTAPLAPPQQTPDGAWVFDAVLATAGQRKKYDHGEEEVTAEALAAAAPLLAGLPITRPEAHPWGEQGMIRPDNARRYILDGARVLEGRFDAASGELRAKILLPRKEDATRGLSVGWHVLEIDKTARPPRQTKLRPNHLTLTDSPRDSTARPRLDATMKKIKIGDVEYEVSEDLYAALMSQQSAMDKLRQDMEAMRGEKDKAAASMSAMDAVLKDVQARLKAADEREQAARLDALRKEIEPIIPADKKPALASTKTEAEALALALEVKGVRLDSQSLDGLRAAWQVLKAQAAQASANLDAQKKQVDAPPARQDAAPFSLHTLNAQLRGEAAPSK